MIQPSRTLSTVNSENFREGFIFVKIKPSRNGSASIVLGASMFGPCFVVSLSSVALPRGALGFVYMI